MTLLNGVGHQCDGKEISVAIHGKSTGGYVKDCSSEEKPKILADTTSIWSTQDLGTNCKKILFDPNKGLKVAVRTGDYRDPFCPNKVELKILDINSKQPRYFCSKIIRIGNTYRNNGNSLKEGRCFSD